jgi:peroxiredoxin 5
LALVSNNSNNNNNNNIVSCAATTTTMSLRTAAAVLRPIRRAAVLNNNTRSSLTAGAAAAVRSFHSTRPAFVKIGDPLPDLDVLQEGSPGNKVNLADMASTRNSMIIIGVPAAFSPACSAQHIPSFIQHPRTKEFDEVAVISVNDAFV